MEHNLMLCEIDECSRAQRKNNVICTTHYHIKLWGPCPSNHKNLVAASGTDGKCSPCRLKEKNLTCALCDKKQYQRGLCHFCWCMDKYGACNNGCIQPANGLHGFCIYCKSNDGRKPKHYVGAGLNTDTQKYCPKCKELLDLSMFSWSKKEAGVLNYNCKPCVNLKKRIKREKFLAWSSENVMQTLLGLCVKCNNPFGKNWQKDHIIPDSLGGPTIYSNLQVLCAFCNGSKGNREIIDYRLFIKDLVLA